MCEGKNKGWNGVNGSANNLVVLVLRQYSVNCVYINVLKSSF
jgi:hypothetical protein